MAGMDEESVRSEHAGSAILARVAYPEDVFVEVTVDFQTIGLDGADALEFDTYCGQLMIVELGRDTVAVDCAWTGMRAADLGRSAPMTSPLSENSENCRLSVALYELIEQSLSGDE